VSTEQTTPPAPVEQGGAFKRFWRGDFSLSVSFWGFGAGGTTALALVLFFAIIVSVATSRHNRHRLAIELSSILIVVVIVTLWQCVGIWRASNRHVAEGKSTGYAFFVRFIVIATILQVVILGFTLKPMWAMIEHALDEADQVMQTQF
jgi:hypothetical protein